MQAETVQPTEHKENTTKETKPKPAKPITQYFGIRHHGPGSAARLVAALNQLKPKKVLIEGPTDCSGLMSALAHRQMKPPVALLAYAKDTPNCHCYYPFAEFSPEYQACLWAVKNDAELAFIDLPINIKLAQQLNEIAAMEEALEADELENSDDDLDNSNNSSNNDTDSDSEDNPESDLEEAEQTELKNIHKDPIGALAKLAGYDDGEAWWHDLIEQSHFDHIHSTSGDASNNQSETQNEAPKDIFNTVANAMTVLREKVYQNTKTDTEDDLTEKDTYREAFMRLQITKESKGVDGNIAVVCGAWHVPALDPAIHIKLQSQQTSEKVTKTSIAKADRELIKHLPKKLAASKVKTTWIPWTSRRLASQTGYGAGVRAPMWYLHLWQHRNNTHLLENWLSRITRELRKQGQVISTASVIEAVRLSSSLAVVRNRPSAGFEEITEAVVSCLCFGERFIWEQVSDTLLLGKDVGHIPKDLSRAPLLEDLQRLQKKTRLKPEALSRELSLDLRSKAGLAKSILLHRLSILGVPWGEMTSIGGSRGTFRERWIISWEPEYAISLVENLVYGNTIKQAANNKLIEAMQDETNLGDLAKTVKHCLEAQLNQATAQGLKRINDRAAQTDNAIELLESLSPLVHIARYGTAREMSLDQVTLLVQQLAIKAALALPYACRNLNDEESKHYRNCLNDAHNALLLAELDDDIMNNWWEALETIIDNPNSSLQVSGLSARLLYQAQQISDAHLAELLQRALSPAIPAHDAAQFFEGFFEQASQRLLYDNILLSTVENWLISLDEEEFVAFLPLFRRVFSDLDANERRRLIDTVLKAKTQGHIIKVFNEDMLPLWQQHLTQMGKLLQRQSDWSMST